MPLRITSPLKKRMTVYFISETAMWFPSCLIIPNACNSPNKAQTGGGRIETRCVFFFEIHRCTAAFFGTITVQVHMTIGGNRLLKSKVPFLDAANFARFAHYLRINESLVYFSAVFRFYHHSVFSDFDLGHFVFHF